MVSANIYSIQDESPFVEREENYEIYREIYGDPIYDVYEDDVRVVDFIFGEDSFANFVCANIGQDEIYAKFGRDKIRAKPVQDELRANFGESQKIRFYESKNDSGLRAFDYVQMLPLHQVVSERLFGFLIKERFWMSC